jgi:hypothetical protein
MTYALQTNVREASPEKEKRQCPAETEQSLHLILYDISRNCARTEFHP